jgi:hypothetical protein
MPPLLEFLVWACGRLARNSRACWAPSGGRKAALTGVVSGKASPRPRGRLGGSGNALASRPSDGRVIFAIGYDEGDALTFYYLGGGVVLRGQDWVILSRRLSHAVDAAVAVRRPIVSALTSVRIEGHLVADARTYAPPLAVLWTLNMRAT